MSNNNNGMNSQYATQEQTALGVRTEQAGEVLRITCDGRIFWNGREVESDDQFRSAMLDLKEVLTKSLNASHK